MSKFKSSTVEAENESSLISMKESMLQAALAVTVCTTNLPVISNLQEANSSLSTTNEKYKKLLASNAESIAKLGQEFEGFDNELAGQMGVVQE